MKLDYSMFAEHIKPMSTIVSVEKFPDGSYGNIRVVAVNSTFLENMDRVMDETKGEGVFRVDFVPDLPYEKYIPKNLNFEEFCYRSAILGETLHTYIQPGSTPVWLYLTAIPLKSDRENIGYCAFIQEYMQTPNYSIMTNIAPDTAAQVLGICMKLRVRDDFMSAVREVIRDIRALCDAHHCCILLTDFAQRKCSVLCEALSPAAGLSSMEKFVDDAFFDIVDTWDRTIAGSTCVSLKSERDWEYLKEQNPVWYQSMRMAGAKNIVLFPLKFRKETIGYIWAINFDYKYAENIKNVLQLTAYFLASEIANFQLFERLEALSSKDMLTGLLNRNAMNNRIEQLVMGRGEAEKAAVVFADINGLKRVNDKEGHFAGDMLLKDAAIILQKHFPDYEIYRAGGDEFLVLAMYDDIKQMETLVQKFKEDTSDPSGVCFAVGFRYGAAGKIGEMLNQADESMYADKRSFYEKHPEIR